MKNILVIFGGADFEEQAARAFAQTIRLATATATLNGVPVHAGNAKLANGFKVDIGKLDIITEVIIFENNPVTAGNLPVILNCDHHSPGDTGYGKSADEYWQASSLGQLMNFFEVTPNMEQLMVAAGDHCLPAAYAGKCPWIDLEEFANFRSELRANFYAQDSRNAHKASKESLEQIVQNAMEKIAQAPVLESGVIDMRSSGYVDELPEAAIRMNKAYIAEIDETDRGGSKTGNKKIVLGGHTTPDVVISFIEWANAHENKVGDAYGDPVRGFAGVVLIP